MAQHPSGRGPRLGLRARVTVTFALGALLLSVVLSGITYGLTRESSVNEREQAIQSVVFNNAATVADLFLSQSGLTAQTLENTLNGLPASLGGQPIVRYREEWIATTAFAVEEEIPATLREAVESGQPAQMRTQIQGVPSLVVGVPLPGIGAQFYQRGSLEDQQRALNGLGYVLLGASALTTLAGGLLGFWVARRVFSPLLDVGKAADAIAGGHLDTRLPQGRDRDLDRLVIPFNDMVQTLEMRIERDARFASEVSHELRSPLMTLAASVEVLENARDTLPERARLALDLLSADVDRFQQLVEDLLEISRFDVGAIHLHLEEVPVAEMVIQAVSSLGGGAVGVRCEEDTIDVVVEVDKRRFARVLANLIDNAAKYAQGASAVVVERHGSRVQIAVEDNGPGIPEEEREVIFDRFSRGSESGKRSGDTGVGLGLALVDEHMRLHGGSAWVEPRRDGEPGARFVVELPVVHIEEVSHDDDPGAAATFPQSNGQERPESAEESIAT